MRKRKRRGMFRRVERKKKVEGMYVHTVKRVNINYDSITFIKKNRNIMKC